jgi:hypothetical protein
MAIYSPHQNTGLADLSRPLTENATLSKQHHNNSGYYVSKKKGSFVTKLTFF